MDHLSCAGLFAVPCDEGLPDLIEAFRPKTSTALLF
jgi:hypothetical protein